MRLLCFAKKLVPHFNTPKRILDSNDSFQQAKLWLQDCNSNHPECQEWQKHQKLPNRLVHVQWDKNTAKIAGNIICSETLPTNTTYLSLSHCWGTVEFLVMTSENLSQLEASLPVHKLSRTIQDAMRVTLKLGFEYIWIDSLCIVQDDLEDWTKQASLMGDVYANASCNISASAAAHGAEGFLLSREFDATPVLVQVDCSVSGEARDASLPDDTYCFAFLHPREEISHGPLFNRGWT